MGVLMLVDPFPLSNGLGFLALGGYILTLLPTNLRIIFPKTKQASMPKWLLKNRRLIGIFSFLLALGHGYLLVKKRDFDFFDPSNYLLFLRFWLVHRMIGALDDLRKTGSGCTV
jgi:methionine sulfoxide reductase heme-binding subunit